jgi:hypothetical protein
MTLVSAPLKFMSATLQPQVEDFQNENRKFVSGCEYAIPSFLLPFLLRSYLLRLIRRLRSALEKGKKAGWKVQDTKNSGLSVLSSVLWRPVTRFRLGARPQ